MLPCQEIVRDPTLTECPGWDSNPHAHEGQRSLSPPRLPIPSPGPPNHSRTWQTGRQRERMPVYTEPSAISAVPLDPGPVTPRGPLTMVVDVDPGRRSDGSSDEGGSFEDGEKR